MFQQPISPTRRGIFALWLGALGGIGLGLPAIGIILPPFLGSRSFKALQRGGKFLLPAGTAVFALGTSTTQRNTIALANRLQGQGYGMLVCARQRNQRFSFANYYDTTDPAGRNFSGDNFGFTGQSNSVLIGKIPEIIAKGYKAGILQMSQNDLRDASKSVSSLIAQVRQAVALFAAGGVTALYLQTATPPSPTGRGNSSAVLPEASPIYWRTTEYNNALEALALDLGVEFIDTRPFIVDPASPVGAVKANYSEDGLHLSAAGAWAASAAIDVAILRTFEAGTALNLDPTSGNLYGNGLLCGTGGALAGTTNSGGTVAQSGRVPDKIRFGTVGSVPYVGACALSVVPDPEQGNALRQTYTFTAADGTQVWRTTFSDVVSSSGQPIVADVAGKWVRTAVQVNVGSGGELLENLQLISGTVGGATTFLVLEAASSVGTGEPVGDGTLNRKTLYLITEPMLVPAGSIGVTMALEVTPAGTGTMVLEVSRPKLFVLDSPVR